MDIIQQQKSKAGRKPEKDKKENITIYVKPSHILKFGGKDSLRDRLLLFIEQQVEKIK
jgi:hypothetical protein